MDKHPIVDIVVFGSQGDLSKRKLIPALFQLFLKGVLSPHNRIVAITRHTIDQTILLEAFRASTIQPTTSAEHAARWPEFAQHIFPIVCDLEVAESYSALSEFLNTTQSIRIFYFSIPPNLFGTVAKLLKLKNCIHYDSRVVVEKPLGHDFKSAEITNATLAQTFPEDKTFRIDHYLGKETVQNIMALRFANTILEPLWCADRIDYIQITVAETVPVGNRAGYYERTGALRDMVQNHLLQLLCIVAMEPPARLTPYAVRDEKLKVLHSLRPILSHDVVEKTVRGQYCDLQGVGPSYRNEPGVAEDSDTETFVALKAQVDNWRWAGMPIYLRTGKCLKQRRSEIVIQFKEVPHDLFSNTRSMSANRLTILLQPEESIRLRLNGKSPGKGMNLEPLMLNLDSGNRANRKSWEAYERLLLDVIQGDLTLFMRRTDIEAAWQWIDPIIEGWQSRGHQSLPYTAGSWGPVESDQLLAQDSHIWHNPDSL
ncbi:MAG: glucose-6-phosphate dehydrogenase [Pseudomonadota bacterium]